ncbi:MAG: molybdenum cofactor biosynthesis protein MoaE [bacterium]
MVELTTERIDTERILRQVEDQTSGGVVLFLGRVRDHADGRQVERMDYEAYAEMALAKLRELEAKTRQKWPVKQMVILHRTGTLELGEVSVAIAVACAHRHEAFEACRYAIDTLKETVPIWKKEHFVDGQAWVKGVVPKARN